MDKLFQNPMSLTKKAVDLGKQFAMKGLLFVPCLLLAAAATAQSNPPATIPKIQVYPKIGTLTPQLPKPNPPQTYVYTLPLDGMPCIVPATRALAPMPNALPVITEPPAAPIPNPGMGNLKSLVTPEKK